jgi:hypothetical protein
MLRPLIVLAIGASFGWLAGRVTWRLSDLAKRRRDSHAKRPASENAGDRR